MLGKFICSNLEIQYFPFINHFPFQLKLSALTTNWEMIIIVYRIPKHLPKSKSYCI